LARRRKPTDPAALARRSIERQEIEAEISRMKANGATVTTDRGGRVISAYRSNVFNLLLQRKTITPNQHDAAYRLSVDWATWKGLDGKGDTFGEIVDGGSGCAELITDRMIRGGKDVAWALAPLSTRHRKLIEAFMVATVEEDRPMQWRGLVIQATGESVRDRQTQLVIACLESLRSVYEGTGERRAA